MSLMKFISYLKKWYLARNVILEEIGCRIYVKEITSSSLKNTPRDWSKDGEEKKNKATI